MNTEYICLAHIWLWNWQSACSGHLNRAGLRELMGQGRASYLWTWKSHCIFSSLRILLRDPDSLNPRKTVLLLYGGGGGQVRLMDRSTSASRREIISCLWATSLGMDSDLLPSQASSHFCCCCCCGEPSPPGVALHPPTPSFFCPSDTTQAGFMPLRPAPTWSRLGSRLKSAPLAANVPSFCGN